MAAATCAAAARRGPPLRSASARAPRRVRARAAAAREAADAAAAAAAAAPPPAAVEEPAAAASEAFAALQVVQDGLAARAEALRAALPADARDALGSLRSSLDAEGTLRGAVAAVAAAAEALRGKVEDAVVAVPGVKELDAEELRGAAADAQATATRLAAASYDAAAPAASAALSDAATSLSEAAVALSHVSAEWAAAYAATAAVLVSFANIALYDPEDLPLEPPFTKYDPAAFEEYFKRRPFRVVRRLAKVSAILTATAVRSYGKDDAVKATALREALVALGPALIKAGQVASSRGDIVPAPYVKALMQLQDRVPPFPTASARALLASELGPSVARRIKGLGDSAKGNPAPVAAASLGQVYKCAVVDDVTGEESYVAVKIQRPGIIEEIALDLLVLSIIAPIVKKQQGLNSDIPGLVDEWGSRFMDELDYTQEARNGAEFLEAMRSRGMDAVTTASVRPDLSSRRVLTTEWIDGERLDRSDAADVPRLCGVALTAYLTMLLDTGTLHSDPHPGNLLRTRDGKLVILDWGLVTNIEPDKRFAILEYIVHLIGRDYAAVPRDLLALGFIPPNKTIAMEDEGVIRVLADVFRALAKGGGAKGVQSSLAESGFNKETAEEARRQIAERRAASGDSGATRSAMAAASAAAAVSGDSSASGSRVEGLATELARIQETYGNLFQIPTYFALILRSFSILEGIGLSTDPDYSIAQECYPYVARRLLTDRSPRARDALESLVYGPDGGRRLDTKRVRQLSDAFLKYAPTATLAAGASDSGRAPSEALDGNRPILGEGAREALRVALAPEGGPLQDIALREAVRLGDATAREALNNVAGALLAPLVAPARAAASLEGLPPLPQGPLALLALDDDDKETLKARDELLALAAQRNSSIEGGEGNSSTLLASLLAPPASPAEAQARLRYGQQLVGELWGLAPEFAPGAQAAGVRLAAAVLEHAAERLEHVGGEPRED